MTLVELLSRQPPVRSLPAARSLIRKKLLEAGTRLVVADDDPTGTQTVHDVPVYMGWDSKVLQEALEAADPLFYLSTNSRALSAEAARDLGYELGGNLLAAVRATGASVALCSRSDSTLRGHYPVELEAMSEALNIRPDGVVIAPAFFEGGRYTVEDIHFVDQGGILVPAHETESAADPTFGYRHSDLKLWVEEKTKGRIRAEQVVSVSLSLLREGGPEAVYELLRTAREGLPIVLNAACYQDLEVFTLALLEAETAGSRFVYRSAASFVKVRGGIPDRPLLGAEELGAGDGGGLVVVGSYVNRTSRQLERLLASGLAVGIELVVSRLLAGSEREREIARVRREAERCLGRGRSVAVYTSRQLTEQDPATFLHTGAVIMDCLCRLVGTLDSEVAFLVAKGGITSVELARSALQVKKATVLGQIIEGVPVWKLGREARWQGVPYVVYPGNVGDDEALLSVVEKLLAQRSLSPDS